MKSLVESIRDSVEIIGKDVSATIYVSKSEGRVIVVANGSGSSATYEHGEAVVLSYEGEESEIGLAVHKALAAYSTAEQDLSKTKLNDWSAFKASKLRSARAFQSAYVWVSVETFRKFRLLVQSSSHGRFEIMVSRYVSFDPDPTKLGASVLRVAACTRTLHEAGLMA